MRRGLRLAALGGLGVLAACASAPVAITVHPLAGKGAYPPQAYINVLRSPPSGNYVPVARLVARGAAGLAEPQVLAALEEKARALGANALVVTNKTTTTQGGITYNPSGGHYSVSAPTTEPKFVGLALHVNKTATPGA